jgi:hypothetical protein
MRWEPIRGAVERSLVTAVAGATTTAGRCVRGGGRFSRRELLQELDFRLVFNRCGIPQSLTKRGRFVVDQLDLIFLQEEHHPRRHVFFRENADKDRP